MITIKVDKETTWDELANLGESLLGKDRVLHFKHIIGNYWEQKITGLDTETLFREMVRIFKKKKVVKKLMDDGRDNAVKRLIEQDIKNILYVWGRKMYRILSRNEAGVLFTQSVTCEKASIIIEEDSSCTVMFKGREYQCEVDGRRAINGVVINNYQWVKADENGLNKADMHTMRKLRVYNNFVGKTFWRTVGRTYSSHVELGEKHPERDEESPVKRRRKKV